MTFRDLSRALKGFGSVRVAVKTRVLQCGSLIKKAWAFIRVPYVNPTVLGLTGPGLLNQVPALDYLDVRALGFRALRPEHGPPSLPGPFLGSCQRT